jgi:leucyl aminopeptidase (aminopeptidase T)
MDEKTLSQFADTVMSTVGRVKPGEVVLIQADLEADQELGQAYLAGAIRLGADADLIVSRYRTSQEPDLSSGLVAALGVANVVFGLGKAAISHHDAVRGARQDRGTRFLMTDTHMGSYLHEGVIGIDYAEMLEDAKLFGQHLARAETVHLGDEAGTDLTFKVSGRPAIVDAGTSDEPGTMSFYPGAQVSVAPIEDTISGLMVVDGSIQDFGVLTEPVRVQLRSGEIVDVAGGAEADNWNEWLSSTGDQKIRRLCHFSLGFNPRAQITGNMMQDERLLAGVDFGFGSQDPKFQGTIGGGSYHTDVMLTNVVVSFDGKQITLGDRFNPEMGFHDVTRLTP